MAFLPHSPSESSYLGIVFSEAADGLSDLAHFQDGARRSLPTTLTGREFFIERRTVPPCILIVCVSRGGKRSRAHREKHVQNGSGERQTVPSFVPTPRIEALRTLTSARPQLPPN